MPLGGLPPGGFAYQGVCLQGGLPPGTRKADGKHPTGMLSCIE